VSSSLHSACIAGGAGPEDTKEGRSAAAGFDAGVPLRALSLSMALAHLHATTAALAITVVLALLHAVDRLASGDESRCLLPTAAQTPALHP
jgi:hypothetical protein